MRKAIYCCEFVFLPNFKISFAKKGDFLMAYVMTAINNSAESIGPVTATIEQWKKKNSNKKLDKNLLSIVSLRPESAKVKGRTDCTVRRLWSAFTDYATWKRSTVERPSRPWPLANLAQEGTKCKNKQSYEYSHVSLDRPTNFRNQLENVDRIQQKWRFSISWVLAGKVSRLKRPY